MAKRAEQPQIEPNGDRLAGFSEDLGKLLGTATGKASAWLDQRKAITEQLTQIRDTANRYLRELTGSASASATTQKSPRRASLPATEKPRRSRKLSAEARKRISEAQRKRWAKVRAASR